MPSLLLSSEACGADPTFPVVLPPGRILVARGFRDAFTAPSRDVRRYALSQPRPRASIPAG
jgi:hypothetical protein